MSSAELGVELARCLSGSESLTRWAGRGVVVKYVLIGLLRAYRALISPLYGQVCRYHPSCSAYALEAVTTHGQRARQLAGGPPPGPLPPLGRRWLRPGARAPHRDHPQRESLIPCSP
jgi:hypothetical protein